MRDLVSDALVEKAAFKVREQLFRYQLGESTDGTARRYARAALDGVAADIAAEAWDKGYRRGYRDGYNDSGESPEDSPYRANGATDA